jgi:hypothetical protein
MKDRVSNESTAISFFEPIFPASHCVLNNCKYLLVKATTRDIGFCSSFGD